MVPLIGKLTKHTEVKAYINSNGLVLRIDFDNNRSIGMRRCNKKKNFVYFMPFVFPTWQWRRVSIANEMFDEWIAREIQTQSFLAELSHLIQLIHVE